MLTGYRLVVIALTVSIAGLSAMAQVPEKRPMSIVDLIDLPSITSANLSPDGSQLLYSKSTADWKANKTVSHIWRVAIDGSGLVRMTNGERGESGGIWSPDGSRIAFVARRGDDEHGQIHLIPNAGGEAIRLTNHPTGVTSLRWSSDGHLIYFRAADDKSEIEKAREEIKDNVFRYDEDKKNIHLWSVNAASRDTTRVTGGDFHVRSYQLSADGSRIAYSRAPTPLLNDALKAEIWIMNLGDSTDGKAITGNAILESGLEFSPDGKQILFWSNTNDALNDYYYNSRLFTLSIDGGAPRCVVCGGQYDVNAARWNVDGSGIYFRANTGARMDVYYIDLDSGELTPYTSGDHSTRLWDFEASIDLHAIAFSSPTDPGEIRVSTGPEASFRQVTHEFEYVREQFRLPEVELVQWAGEDGVDVEGLLFYPLNYEEGTRYPLVVQTHGGPASSDQFRFPRSINYETVLTSMGYAVLKPNYRGSTGYGDDFLRDMVGHYFNEAHKDVMAGVDYLIDRGIVDGDRLAKMGWSAGGHMTNKIITYTNRFKAAASGAGAINWVSMYGQSEVRFYRTPWFGGDPWSDGSPIDQFMSDSPLYDIHRVTTPTIVLVGENDNRVPMPQSVELYRALKHNGVPTHLYVAPEQGHGWRELQQRLFKANVEIAWFEEWVTERQYDWEKSPETDQ